ncbi:hypothetical protein EMIHUDRAFT_249951 [Emiliania huxleyi CCMP1516]|uniref:U-box domain-containing protein n=2 Tax=Emiliania huxleyi TaxID=2903 RepID=A0A0D3I4T4_EMIH1|nr:hypothetical protein EMIHUDRAFT_249951 [Emiliania huxleyi CCMP1516]EOD06269.1 hypothetical protein EMIHUDRAFT_249951 [Emiliania huxleyi CCMP1516]|eukprot:XP_005758698.1 hypothetical protein EMIHUDRAFT_249951 [Emiliania huxleyi CCMP1516]
MYDTVSLADQALDDQKTLADLRMLADQTATLSPTGSPPQPEAPPREEPPPADFICPITTEVMSDPVMATDGHSYERKQIERWLATKSTSPMTGEALEHSILTPNHALRGRIREWQEAHH